MRKLYTGIIALSVLLIAIYAASLLYFTSDAFGQEPYLPQSEVHPVLLYTAADVPIIQDRINREPYKAWFGSALLAADSFRDRDYSNFSSEYERAYAAKMLSFAYAFDGGEGRAKKADELLSRAGGQKYKDLVQYYSVGLADYAAAYDMLKGAGWAFSNEKQVRENLISQAKLRNNLLGLYQEYPDFFGSITSVTDNHELRKASAVGMAALATINEEDSKQLFKKSQADFARVVRTMSGKKAVWGEGPNYFVYSMQLGFPFMRALKNAGGPDYFEKIRLIDDWAYNLTLPNGRLPNYDDSEFSLVPWSLATDSQRQVNYNWQWVHSISPYSGAYGEFAPDTIASYDDLVAQIPPAYPSLVAMPGTAGAIFRSGNEQNSTYFLFLAEHGDAVSPEGHEHPDGLAIMGYSNGGMFLVDSGYLGYSNHGLVNKPENHNVLLADGQGQPQKYIFFQNDLFKIRDMLGLSEETHAYLTQWSDLPAGSSASAKASYANAAFERTVIFFNNSYFAVFDSASSSYSRNYTALFHTGAPTTSTLFGGKGAQWNYGENSKAALLSDSQVALYQQNFSKEAVLSQQETVSIGKQGQSARFVTVLLPDSSLVKDFASYESAQGAWLVLKLADGSEDFVAFPAGKTFLEGGIKTDSGPFILRTRNGAAVSLLASNATFFSFNGENVLK